MLKQKGWEASPDGIAALSILLLQDLAVAPLLVVLPLVAGTGPQDPQTLGLLAAKATFGFGAVLWACSYLLRLAFELVASARSTETFVAATLLVAVGMGRAAEELGLSATTGAFAAGVLLAGNKFRAQIQADIKPFEGILLGVFFMTAGANLDPQLVLREWPTLSVGIVAFIVTKAAVLFAAGPALGLARAEAAGGTPARRRRRVRLRRLQARQGPRRAPRRARQAADGVGDHLDVAHALLGEVAGWVADRIEDVGVGARGQAAARGGDDGGDGGGDPRGPDRRCGRHRRLRLRRPRPRFARSAGGGGGGGDLVAFDLNPSRVSAAGLDDDGPPLFHGDGASVELLRAAGLRAPRAIVITYRLRQRVVRRYGCGAFPKSPSTREEAPPPRPTSCGVRARPRSSPGRSRWRSVWGALGGGEASDAAAACAAAPPSPGRSRRRT